MAAVSLEYPWPGAVAGTRYCLYWADCRRMQVAALCSQAPGNLFTASAGLVAMTG